MNYLFVQLIILFVLFSNSRTDQDIQTYTIAVINALFLKAPEEKRQVRLHFLSHCISQRSGLYMVHYHISVFVL